MGFLVSNLGRLFKILPPEAQTVLKSKLNPVGKLDFPDKHISMVIDSKTQIYKSKACKDEPETVSWIRKNMKEGDVFYDVGANVGAFSFIAWAVAEGKCKVYAFEPSFSTFAALCQNIILNKAHNEIVPVYSALGPETALTDFYYTSIVPGKCRHSIISPKHSNLGDFTPEAKLGISCYRLDDLIKTMHLAQPNYLKIDVDGVELEILKGAEATLKNPALRSVLVEVNSNEEAIDKILSVCGFREKEFVRGNKIYDRK